MPHPDWEDLSAFFDPDEFATSAVIARGSETVAEVLGIFDDPNQVARLGEYELDHVGPRFVCSEVAVAGVIKGDTATIEGTTWDIIREPELDGTGIATLMLAAQNVIYNAGL